jgi:hypothetical protein
VTFDVACDVQRRAPRIRTGVRTVRIADGRPDCPRGGTVRTNLERSPRPALGLVFVAAATRWAGRGAVELGECGQVFSGIARPSFAGTVSVELVRTWSRAGAPL